MGYINASKIAQYPPNLNRYQQVDDDSSVLWLEKAQSGKVSMEDIKDALAEFTKLFKVGMASKAEILTLARAFPDSPVYTEAARKQSEKYEDEPVVIGGPASVSLVDREGHLITTGALERAFKKFMANDRTRNVMVLHSDVQVGWALPAYISKGGQIFKSGVNDNGLFFICELRDDTAISKKVSDQIHKGMLKSYSIAGSATKIQNMTKGLVPYLQVDDMELAEVTICEKGVNQGAGFELLKAEMPPIPKPPRIIAPIRKMNMQSNDDGTLNFNKSFTSWMQKEHKDPLTTKESFVTLNNEAGRKAEHEQLMREYGFPSEQSYETMRYVPVVETETDDDGIPIHNLPPWVVNEAGEALGDRLDEDAPDYDKSAKAEARQKAGSAQKMFYDFMGIEKAGEGKQAERDALSRVKASDEERQKDQTSSDSANRRSMGARLSRAAARTKRDAPGQLRAGATRAGEAGKGVFSGLTKPSEDVRPKTIPAEAPGVRGEGGRFRKPAPAVPRDESVGAGSREGGATVGRNIREQVGRSRRGVTGYLGGLFGRNGKKDRTYRRADQSAGEPVEDVAGKRGAKAGDITRRAGKAAGEGVGKFFRGFGRASAPGQRGREFAERTRKEDESASEKIGYGAGVGARGATRQLGNVVTDAGRLARGGAKAAAGGFRAGQEQRQGLVDRVDTATGRPPQGAGSISDHHKNLGIGEGKIFSHPDFHGLDHDQQRAQVRESMMQRGGKTLEDHLKNYQHLVGNYPSTDKNGTAGDKIGHVTVNSLPKGHHAGTPMDNNEFHQLIQDGHVGFEPTPQYANANWQEHKAHVDSHFRDASHIPPAIGGAASQTQIAGTNDAAAVGQDGANTQVAANAQGGASRFQVGKPPGSQASMGATITPPTQAESQAASARKYMRGPGGMTGQVANSIDKMLFKALGVKKRVNR